jgi:CRISPR type I-E-associated protein CasB/Cse2
MDEKQRGEKSRIGPFLEYLQKHFDDRGMMADLRRGFSRTTEYRAWPYIAMWCDLTNERSRRVLLTVAAGFALHKRNAEGGNLGTSLRMLATGDGRGLEGLATFDARFRRFLSCSRGTEVCDHLPGVLRAAERKGVPVDFAQLYRDLTYWGDRVKVEWAKEYWGGTTEDADLQGEGEAGSNEQEAAGDLKEEEVG